MRERNNMKRLIISFGTWLLFSFVGQSLIHVSYIDTHLIPSIIESVLGVLSIAGSAVFLWSSSVAYHNKKEGGSK